ncbi:MAG: 5'-nucleotidase C-terminal domain-containing protein [Alphaproteobacteria bacterium]|nr:5'-nucleotidase C-terminal domain-containing protein [Alphaproteobacteria bacterium]
MDTQNNNIKIFALTDCHQEARKLCCLFSGIIRRVPKGGKDTLICDCGDLFKGIYDRDLCVESYLRLRQQLPEAKIVFALGNNDFGFNHNALDYLIQAAHTFNQANIHVLCANLIDMQTETYPKWVDPYILLEINHKKILITSFCVNYVHLRKFGLRLSDISESFLRLKDTIKHIHPDAFIILNHALYPCCMELYDAAVQNDIPVDLIIGGHEHAPLEPDTEHHIYYPRAFSRTMCCFNLKFTEKRPQVELTEIVSCKEEDVHPAFLPALTNYENAVGLNMPIAPSILNLERKYADPCAIGTFIADLMKKAGHADIALISTGYIVHALRYEENKILTHYNVERAFSAETPLQTVVIKAAELKDIFNNMLHYRYILQSGNTRFLQASQNITLVCHRTVENTSKVKQIFINGEPLFDDNGKELHPEETFVCAIDPFIGAGELGFDAFRPLPKETLLRNNQLIKIKNLFIKAISEAPEKYAKGSTYPSYKIIDAEE